MTQKKKDYVQHETYIIWKYSFALLPLKQLIK